MNETLETLISNLPKGNTLLLTALLSEHSLEGWNKNRHIIVCNVPRLSLEMAINRATDFERNTIPCPKQIHEALKSIQQSSQHSLAMIANG